MQLFLRLIAIVSFLVSIVWVIQTPSTPTQAIQFEPILAALAGLTSLALSFAGEKGEGRETLDKQNRRKMLDHVENAWVKGVLENSLHGVALLELGIKEDLEAVNYPWKIKRGATDEVLPAGKSMLEIFQNVGLGRSLLILGEAGAGKTTMLLELTRLLVKQAQDDQTGTEPIPVFFQLGSWTENQSLADWLTAQLKAMYFVPRKTASAWIKEDKMLLLLDGLDEVEKESRAKCVDAINRFRDEHGLTSLAVCCRSEEYKAMKTELLVAGKIIIQPLTSDEIHKHLDLFGESLTPLKQLLKEDPALRELAASPLMLSVMTLAYKDGKIPEPYTSLTVEERRKHIFERYIQRMFERPSRLKQIQFTKEQTLHSLNWLARTMKRENIRTYQIESMQPGWIGNKAKHRLYKLFLGLIYGIGGGLVIGLNSGLGGGLIFGLTMGLLGSVVGALYATLSDNIEMVDQLKWSWREAPSDVPLGLLLGSLVGLVVWLILGMAGGWSVVLILVVIFSLLGGIIMALNSGLTSEEVEEATYPEQHLKQTYWNALLSLLLYGLSTGLAAWLLMGIFVDWESAWISALSVGIGVSLIGLLIGLLPILQHYILRWVLTKQSVLPHPLIPFLDYCVSLVFLRQTGGAYIFIHPLLLEHFAEREV